MYVNLHTPLAPHSSCCRHLSYILLSFYSPPLSILLSYTFSLSIYCLSLPLLFIHHNLQLINRDPEFRLGCGTSNQAQAVMEHSFFSNTPMDPDEEVRWAGLQWVWPH